ncbi:hypothetical protein H8B09_11720 [Paenibacillus sp. PR3]|uniref:Lipoprotein n=1 Tax=Paenibacillus terricola TaxID=2763503 RepID=A0ABR8MTY4_9BACL|nr:hypothetical protein [Paenibacillus terricola]MBD3919422.1 hypothetical protein [Paenibacillus terricola]
MNKWMLVLVVVALLGGCSNRTGNPTKGNSVIDWVDFVKLNGTSYTGLFESVIKDPNDVTKEVVGEVSFKVADVVTNPSYKTKSGDAAFLEIGTKLYRVKGFETNEMIAAEDVTRIGGFRLYASDEFAITMKYKYKDVPKDKVARVELYLYGETKPFKTLNNSEAEQFIMLLENGKDNQNYSSPNNGSDPTYYSMVFYTDEPLAYAFTLVDDGTHVFFTPRDTRIVDDEIRKLIR